MVKGVARRVIVVKSPDPKLFEQAIFLLREDAFRGTNSPDQVLREAQQVADGYVLKNSPMGKKRKKTPPAFFGALGALFASAFWLLCYGFCWLIL